MSLSRLSISLILFLSVAACGARSFGGPYGDGGVWPPDGSVSPDGSVAPDGSVQVYDSYGYISFMHLQPQGYQYLYESIMLSAWFYGEEWDPFVRHDGSQEPLYVQTPDGVPCEITLVSGMDGPNPPQPPPGLDGGEIYAWGGSDEGDNLEIAFNGGEYDSDYRSPDGSAPWPFWMTDAPLQMQFESTGSAFATSFYTFMPLPEMPEIRSPPARLDEPLTPDPDGTHRISWTAVQADSMEINLHFNMDWDDSVFRCFPPAGRTEMRLPHEWLVEYSWGYGELNVYAVNKHIAHAGNSEMVLRSIRICQLQLNILVWE